MKLKIGDEVEIISCYPCEAEVFGYSCIGKRGVIEEISADSMYPYSLIMSRCPHAPVYGKSELKLVKPKKASKKTVKGKTGNELKLLINEMKSTCLLCGLIFVGEHDCLPSPMKVKVTESKTIKVSEGGYEIIFTLEGKEITSIQNDKLLENNSKETWDFYGRAILKAIEMI